MNNKLNRTRKEVTGQSVLENTGRRPYGVTGAKYFRFVGDTPSATTYCERESKPDSIGGRNQEEALELDRIHIEESTQLRYKTRPLLESSRLKEKRNTKEHITPRNEDRHEKNEQELDRTTIGGLKQSRLENVSQRLTFH
ncbi:unnamed protein product [Schistosoma curassoni]|uniref:Uncharacterized protein n=1 Tax=Schistosoma curassoni TaxID=6186 RepID=A0A183KCD4_9TREM|nr:unnamed protein product [Schistosoma curassoni]